MQELELKLEVAPERREKVAQAFAEVRRQRLAARYFDTAEQDLARHGVVVRLRKEGARWVQTAKAGAGHALERLEHSVELPALPGQAMPALDLARHDHTPLARRLRKALGLRRSEPYPPLLAGYETEVQRQAIEVRAARSTVEIAFDRGRAVAGEREAAICELEF